MSRPGVTCATTAPVVGKPISSREVERQFGKPRGVAEDDSLSASFVNGSDGRRVYQIPGPLFDDISRAHDRLQRSIGHAASHFTRSERGTWQHDLLLKSKEMHVAMDELKKRLRDEQLRQERLADQRRAGESRSMSPRRPR